MLPLDGVTVVSLEQAVAAPFASRQLADLGAHVIKVERPEGDFSRRCDETVHGLSSHFLWLNRSKESITLDVKTPTSREVLDRLLSRADVFVQNLAPGATARIGPDAATCATRWPRLIVCDISGYGSSGPSRHKKACDLLVQGEAGLISLTGTAAAPTQVAILPELGFDHGRRPATRPVRSDSDRKGEPRDGYRAEPMTATLDLAAGLVALGDGLADDSPPEPTLDAARAVLLDHLSASMAYGDDPVVIASVALGDALGTPTATIRVPGSDRLHDVIAAAFVTAAVAGTGVTGSGESVRAGRFVAPALGAALALGQLRPVSGERWLTAFALGCETHLRIARALDPDLVERGWDPTGPCGVLGAATAAALMVGADAQALAATWGAAAGQTLGHRRAAEAGLAGLHAGQAAANGALAALLVDAGFTASSRVFEAPRGVLTALVGHHDTSRLLAGSGEWMLPDEVSSATSLWPPACAGEATATSPALAAAVHALDRAPDLGELLDALAPPAGRPTR